MFALHLLYCRNAVGGKNLTPFTFGPELRTIGNRRRPACRPGRFPGAPPLDRSGENLPEAFVQLDKTDAGERDFVYTGPGCGCRSGRPGTCSGLASHSGVTAPSRVALHAREPFHQSSRTGGSLTTRFTARLTVSNSLSTFPRIRYPLFISTSWQKRRKADGKKTVS